MGSANCGHVDGPRFAVVGQHTAGSRAVRHVGVLQRECSVQIGTLVDVFHMGPPIAVGQDVDRRASGYSEQMAGDILAWLENLTPEQSEGIGIWIEQIRIHLREKTQVYEYHVRCEEQLSEDGSMVRFRRFSCAGFVERCYREGAGITLVVEEEYLPAVDTELFEHVWAPSRSLSPPAMRRWRDTMRTRMEGWGLKGPGPWKLLLPGYLLHAIHGAGNRGLPYQPGAADFEF